MDWYSWLLKSSGLDRSLVYEYSLLLSQNELEEDDIAHFDHEFLLSMGIAVAKHRLEILKLAKIHRRRRRRLHPAQPVAALFTVIHKACDCLTRYVHDLVDHQSKELAVVPRASRGGRQMVSNVMRRSRRMSTVKKGRLMITDSVCNGVKAVQLGRSPASQSLSPLVLLSSREEGHEDGFNWAGYNDTEQMRWDSMFQDLKPT